MEPSGAPRVDPDENGRAVAALLRSLADRLAVSDVSTSSSDRVRRLLSEAVGLLGPPSGPTRFARQVASSGATSGHPLETGASPVYPAFTMTTQTTGITIETRFGPAWEGPPGLVHGGFLAAGFDMALSTLAGMRIGPSVTRWLRLRYLRPTPIGAALRFEVEAFDPKGRLLDLAGRLHADERLTMRATCQFASVSPERFEDLASRR